MAALAKALPAMGDADTLPVVTGLEPCRHLVVALVA